MSPRSVTRVAAGLEGVRGRSQLFKGRRKIEVRDGRRCGRRRDRKSLTHCRQLRRLQASSQVLKEKCPFYGLAVILLAAFWPRLFFSLWLSCFSTFDLARVHDKLPFFCLPHLFVRSQEKKSERRNKGECKKKSSETRQRAMKEAVVRG